MSTRSVSQIRQEIEERKFMRYVFGYLISVILTLSAYYVVVNHKFSSWLLIMFISMLAIVQFFVQIFLFLHLGEESKPRHKLGIFLFMILMVLIIVVGSIWIMNNLNYRMMSPTEINKYMNTQDGGV